MDILEVNAEKNGQMSLIKARNVFFVFCDTKIAQRSRSARQVDAFSDGLSDILQRKLKNVTQI